jgi:hypothetical protein
LRQLHFHSLPRADQNFTPLILQPLALASGQLQFVEFFRFT